MVVVVVVVVVIIIIIIIIIYYSCEGGGCAFGLRIENLGEQDSCRAMSDALFI